MTRVYYKEAVGALVVFDMTRLSTFQAVLKWKGDLDSKVHLEEGLLKVWCRWRQFVGVFFLMVRSPSATGGRSPLCCWPTSAISALMDSVRSCPDWRASPESTGSSAGTKPPPRQELTVFSVIAVQCLSLLPYEMSCVPLIWHFLTFKRLFEAIFSIYLNINGINRLSAATREHFFCPNLKLETVNSIFSYY